MPSGFCLSGPLAPRALVQMTSLVFAYFALQFDHLRYCNVFAGFDARGSAEHFIA